MLTAAWMTLRLGWKVALQEMALLSRVATRWREGALAKALAAFRHAKVCRTIMRWLLGLSGPHAVAALLARWRDGVEHAQWGVQVASCGRRHRTRVGWAELRLACLGERTRRRALPLPLTLALTLTLALPLPLTLTQALRALRPRGRGARLAGCARGVCDGARRRTPTRAGR